MRIGPASYRYCRSHFNPIPDLLQYSILLLSYLQLQMGFLLKKMADSPKPDTIKSFQSIENLIVMEKQGNTWDAFPIIIEKQSLISRK